MASTVVACDSLISDLTCSLCRQLYETPKILPSCEHTFCFGCLEKIKTSSSIKCPDCQQEISLVTCDVKDFPTSVALEKVVAKMRKAKEQQENKKEVPPDDGDICPHPQAPFENREVCRHCGLNFCNSCKYRHIDKIREQVADFTNVQDELLSSQMSIDDLVSQVEARLKEDVKAIDASLETTFQSLLRSIVETLRTRKKQISDGVQRQVDEEMARLRGIAASFSDNKQMAASIKERYLRMASVSVFRLSLDEAAQLCLDISPDKQIVDTLSGLLAPEAKQSWLEFEPVTDANKQLVQCLDEFPIGAFKLTKAALLIGCQMKVEAPMEKAKTVNCVSTAVQTDTTETFSLTMTAEAEKKPKVKSPPAPATAPAPAPVVAAVEKAVVKKQQAQLRDVQIADITHLATKVLALPSQGLFAVLSVSSTMNRLTLYHPHGGIKDVVNVFTPAQFRNLSIVDIATDYRLTIFAIVVAVDHYGLKWRHICRFWISEPGSTEPTPFALGREPSNPCIFRGLAISQELRWVFSTDGNEIVAFESIDLHKGEMGWLVARWQLGPNPFLHAVEDCYSGKKNNKYSSTAIICSTDDGEELLTLSIKAGRRGSTAEVRPYYNADSPMCLQHPNAFCHWQGGNGLGYLKGEFLHFADANGDCYLKCKFPSNLSDDSLPSNVASFAVLAPPNQSNSRKNPTVAVLYRSQYKTIAFAELIIAE